MKAKHLLIVEDDLDTKVLLRYLLNAEYRLAFASNGLTALDILHGLYGEPHTPDCVLLDLCMPQFDGFEFMRAKNSDKTVRVIPVIVMTALNVNSEKVKAIEGARAIMQKPYDMDELFATIREALN